MQAKQATMSSKMCPIGSFLNKCACRIFELGFGGLAPQASSRPVRITIYIKSNRKSKICIDYQDSFAVLDHLSQNGAPFLHLGSFVRSAKRNDTAEIVQKVDIGTCHRAGHHDRLFDDQPAK